MGNNREGPEKYQGTPIREDQPPQNTAGSSQFRLDRDQLQSAAFLAKSLSDGNRLRILQLISSGSRSVSAIIRELELSQPLVSHHLKELKRSLLVTVNRQGQFIYYELADARILDVLETLSDVAADLLDGRTTL